MAEPASQAWQFVEAVAAWLRDETGRVGERATDGVSATLRELGFVTQSEHEELELRVAQLEHRLRLLEALPTPAEPVTGSVDDLPPPPA
jgi:polyhydroxyalkanoate synthesis regulator phasin